MSKSATDVMQDIVFSAVIDSIGALKAASKGVPNTLLRDLNSVHANTTLADLPPELQAAIATNVRAAFTRLLKEGYNVAPAGSTAPRTPPPPAPRVARRPAPSPAQCSAAQARRQRPGQAPRPKAESPAEAARLNVRSREAGIEGTDIRGKRTRPGRSLPGLPCCQQCEPTGRRSLILDLIGPFSNLVFFRTTAPAGARAMPGIAKRGDRP